MHLTIAVYRTYHVLVVTWKYYDYYSLNPMMNNEKHFSLKIKNIRFVFEFINNIPGFDPANVREKLPDDNSGIFTPSSISSMRRNSIGIG